MIEKPEMITEDTIIKKLKRLVWSAEEILFLLQKLSFCAIVVKNSLKIMI